MDNNIDIDKYIDWYKNECEKSQIAMWENRKLDIIHFLRFQTNYDCKTYVDKEKALLYKTKINKKYSQKVKELNELKQPTYYPNEWLVPSFSQWNSFDKIVNQNPHILELDRLLNLCKDTKEARQNTINIFIENLKKEPIENLESIEKVSFIQLDFFDKGSYFANEKPNFMEYCQEQSFFSLIHDYYKIKAFDFANDLIEVLLENKDLPNNNELTHKQVALLCYYLKDVGILHTNKISQDATQQCILICKIFNIRLTGKIINNNFYKYWNSAQSVSDNQKVRTKDNLRAIFNYCKSLNNSNLILKIKEDL